jgi:hypothetical protein
MPSDSSSTYIASLNDADSIVGSTLCIITMLPHHPSGNANRYGKPKATSPVIHAPSAEMVNDGNEIIIRTTLPMPTSTFIIEWLLTMLNNKTLCLYQKSKKKTATREGIIYLWQVCFSLCLNHSSSKGICVKQVIKYYFENPEEMLTSAFKEGVNQENWKKAVALADKERSQRSLMMATSILDETQETVRATHHSDSL